MKEGTTIVELMPPNPWPVAERKLIGPRVPMGDAENWLRIFAMPDGRLKLELAEMAKGTVVLNTCPLTFTGDGYFRLAMAWGSEGQNATAFAGGVCVGSNDPELQVHLSAAIQLRETLPPLPSDVDSEATINFEPGRSGHSI